MIQCSQCEFCHRGSEGERVFTCDPFSNIKEPECLLKWQLIKLNTMLGYQGEIHQMHERMAPMQEKLFQYMEREMEEQNEAEKWKQSIEDDDEDEDPEDY